MKNRNEKEIDVIFGLVLEELIRSKDKSALADYYKASDIGGRTLVNLVLLYSELYNSPLYRALK